MRIVLPGCPPSLNRFAGRENAWEYRQTKEKWTRLVVLACRAAGVPEKPFEYADVGIAYYFKTNIRRDADNYAGKFLLDGLTLAGVIQDDDMRHIRLHIAGGWDREKPRTVITVHKRMREEIE